MKDILQEAADFVDGLPLRSDDADMAKWLHLTRKKAELRKTHTALETEAIILREDGIGPKWSPE